ncbi:hypothetical protein C1N53_12600 [Pontibacter sp. SGAir0037]|nr:hypothetical protein C1N53_12600 [Pontibacter sp. SGAir0037]
MLTVPTNPATIRVHDRVTHQQFGCDEKFFQEHVKGKDLPVLKKYNSFYVVLPVAGTNPETDSYTVHESELLPKDQVHGNA